MTAFITSFSEIIALILQALRLPSLLPAIAFAAANGLLIFPKLSNTMVGNAFLNSDEPAQALILILSAVMTAYYLSVLNLTIIRWFEGYPLIELGLWPGEELVLLHQSRHSDLEKRINQFFKDDQGLGLVSDPRRQRQFNSDVKEFTLLYPQYKSRIVPTRLGNAVVAAEDYPHALYKMDSVVLWALLVPILVREGYGKFIEREKASLDFLLNTIVIIAILGIEIVLIGIHNHEHWYILGLEAIAVLITSWLLYNLSIEAAIGWGRTIRTAFDLYRHKLRDELKLKDYKDFDEESELWRNVSDFYKLRAPGFGQEIFDYLPKKPYRTHAVFE